MIYLYADKNKEPFVDIKLSELKFDLFPVKIDDKMSYFTLKIYKQKYEWEYIYIGCKTKERVLSWFRAFVSFLHTSKQNKSINRSFWEDYQENNNLNSKKENLSFISNLNDSYMTMNPSFTKAGSNTFVHSKTSFESATGNSFEKLRPVSMQILDSKSQSKK